MFEIETKRFLQMRKKPITGIMLSIEFLIFVENLWFQKVVYQKFCLKKIFCLSGYNSLAQEFPSNVFLQLLILLKISLANLITQIIFEIVCIDRMCICAYNVSVLHKLCKASNGNYWQRSFNYNEKIKH